MNKSTRDHPARIATVALFAVSLSFCGGVDRADPKDTLKALFDAMRTSDSLTITSCVDLASAARDVPEDLPEDVGTVESRLLAAMTGEGGLRARWLESQIVLGKSRTIGDTALVEVSFIDRLTRVQYYNKMRLVYREGRWVITAFRTL